MILRIEHFIRVARVSLSTINFINCETYQSTNFQIYWRFHELFTLLFSKFSIAYLIVYEVRVSTAIAINEKSNSVNSSRVICIINRFWYVCQFLTVRENKRYNKGHNCNKVTKNQMKYVDTRTLNHVYVEIIARTWNTRVTQRFVPFFSANIVNVADWRKIKTKNQHLAECRV